MAAASSAGAGDSWHWHSPGGPWLGGQSGAVGSLSGIGRPKGERLRQLEEREPLRLLPPPSPEASLLRGERGWIWSSRLRRRSELQGRAMN